MSRVAYARLPVSLDLPLLLQALAEIRPEQWQGHFNAEYYQGDWSGVALIAPQDALTELAPGQGAAVERAPWQRDSRWQQALCELELEIRSARLLRVGPGSRIFEHRDYDLAGPEADLRLHIPLLSPPLVDFMLDGQRMPLAAGECWFLDLSRPHSVDNRDCSERIHLVLDCRPGPWLSQAIAAGCTTTPAPGEGAAAAAFTQFRQLLEEHPSLCQSLQALTDGEAFIAHTLALAAQHGLQINADQVRAAMRQGRRQWNEQWSH
ncbi:aspartyl/asparaginyl beta-hydroxylase domain-containing protein [Pseudomonas sp. QD4]|uniref:aspartyl/asparaginyl beta-hydroxylase domain-containing protein n=1 Tax=Pseudomonas sp. QD4 TaxID=3368618 RepID=UPI003BA2C3DB